jgi:16S rRNA processing protein RimM
MADSRPAGEWLLAGVVGRPHGLDGSFHVTRARGQLLVPGATVVIGDAEREVQRRAGTDEHPIVRLAGAADRDAAEGLRGAELLVPREAAPELEEDEFWAEDLEGCAVRDGDTDVGVVRRMLALPSCEVLEVRRAGRSEDLLVPLVRDAVRSVDVEAGVIDIDLAFLGEDA